MRRAAMSRPPATPACSTSACRSCSARPLRPEEESNYDLPQISDDVGTLYEHCVRAIDHGLRFGAHGLPLMGCGDWNDGMNLVGQHGKGESVWLAFFLYDVLTQFVELARRRGDVATVDKYTLEAGRLRGNIEEHGWDGEWYRRAYFDDGTPLGSAANPECQIDSLSQSWSVLSGAGTNERTVARPWKTLDRRLVRRDARLIQLLDPPFDKSDLNPGYIKGYVPGVRENGGQYTHARHLDGHGLRGDGRCQTGVGAFHADQPRHPRRHARGRRRLPGRALCRGGRRLRRAAPHRPRRLDLVHRLGRLDVSAHHRIAARAAAGRGQASLRAVPSRRIGHRSRSTTAIAKPSTTSLSATAAPEWR